MDTLKFSVDKLELLEMANSELMKMKFWIVREGNNRHNLPISWSAIELSKSTLVGKPILAKYDAKKDKLLGHEKDEIPVGVFLKEEDITFDVDEDGNRWLCAIGYVWKRYAKDVANLLDKNGGTDVSMEIAVIEKGEKDSIEVYFFTGLTLIGVTPAIPNARGEVLEFAVLKNKVEELIKEEDKFSVETFYKKSSKSQRLDLDLQYDSQDNSKNNNIKKEDKLMAKFDKVEFARISGMTAEEMSNKMYEACGQMKYGDDNWTKYGMRTYCGQYAYAYDYESGKMMAIPYSMNEGSVSMDFEKATPCRMAYVIDEDGDSDDALMSFAMSIVDEKNTSKETELKELNEKVVAFEAEKVEFSTKVEELNNKVAELTTANESLTQFKSNVEEQIKKDQIEFAIQSVGEKLSQTQVDEWRSKVNDYETVELFTQAIKAFAFDLDSKKEPETKSFSRVAIPAQPTNENKSGSVWSKL